MTKDLSNYRFNESSFLVYEDLITKMVEVYPKAFVITHDDLRRMGRAAETVRGRCRDALAGYIGAGCKWGTKINRQKFLAIEHPYRDLKMRVSKDGTIIAGYDITQLVDVNLTDVIEPSVITSTIDCDCPGQDLMIRMCLAGLFPSGITVTGFSPAQVAQFSELDVVFKPLENNTYLLR